MPEIRIQRPGGSVNVSSAEIHIPDDSDLGTGTFTTVCISKSMPPPEAFSSVMLNPPKFQISVVVNPSGDITVLLGQLEPIDQAMFRLPQDVGGRTPRALKIEFRSWRIVAATFDDRPLRRLDTPPHEH